MPRTSEYLQRFSIFNESDGAEAWANVSEEDKTAMNYYEKHSVAKKDLGERNRSY